MPTLRLPSLVSGISPLIGTAHLTRIRSVEGNDPEMPYPSAKPDVDAESLDSSSAKLGSELLYELLNELLREEYLVDVRETGGSDVRSQLVASLSLEETDAIEAVMEEGGKMRNRMWFDKHRGTGIDT